MADREQKWRQLPPVDDRIEFEDRMVSQTFLRTHDRCERSAFLYRLHEGGPGSHELDRGTLFHTFVANGIRHLLEVGEPQLPGEVAKDLLTEAFAQHPELVVPAAERESLRAMAWNFAAGTRFDPDQVVGIEAEFRLPIGNWIVRGRIDLIELVGEDRIDVTDWKTSWAMDTQADIDLDFQTTLYALGVAYGEIDGIQLGNGINQFGLRKVYPRWATDEGLASRFTLIDRSKLADFRDDLAAQLDRLEANLRTGRWQAVPGSHCAECTAPHQCPLPRHLRPDSQMAVASPDDARKLAEWLVITTDRTRRAKSRLKAWASKEGVESIPAGTDLEFRFEHRTSRSVKDLDRLLVDVEGATEYGHPFDPEDHVTEKQSTTFDRRRVRS